MKSLMAWFKRRSNSRQRPQTATPTVERLETRDVPSAASFAVANGIVRSQENFNDFVTFEYINLLRRAPDQAGLNHWVFEMQTGMSPEQVEAGFASSPEYLLDHGNDTAAFVTGLYNDLLGRAPDIAGFSDWVARLQTGTSASSVALGFARSPERETMVIREDYANFLGRLARTDEIAAWLASSSGVRTAPMWLLGSSTQTSSSPTPAAIPRPSSCTPIRTSWAARLPRTRSISG
jgi:hypothetical protein